jgi:hypothetical protein
MKKLQPIYGLGVMGLIYRFLRASRIPGDIEVLWALHFGQTYSQKDSFDLLESRTIKTPSSVQWQIGRPCACAAEILSNERSLRRV